MRRPGRRRTPAVLLGLVVGCRPAGPIASEAPPAGGPPSLAHSGGPPGPSAHSADPPPALEGVWWRFSQEGDRVRYTLWASVSPVDAPGELVLSSPGTGLPEERHPLPLAEVHGAPGHDLELALGPDYAPGERTRLGVADVARADGAELRARLVSGGVSWCHTRTPVDGGEASRMTWWTCDRWPEGPATQR